MKDIELKISTLTEMTANEILNQTSCRISEYPTILKIVGRGITRAWRDSLKESEKIAVGVLKDK